MAVLMPVILPPFLGGGEGGCSSISSPWGGWVGLSFLPPQTIGSAYQYFGIGSLMAFHGQKCSKSRQNMLFSIQFYLIPLNTFHSLYLQTSDNQYV